jgi:DNA-binding transcriptional MerR regulator
LITVSRLDNNYREFDDSIVEVIHTIQLYLNLGLTTDQIKDIMYCKYPENHEFGEKDKYCEDLLQIYETKLDEVIRQQNEKLPRNRSADDTREGSHESVQQSGRKSVSSSSPKSKRANACGIREPKRTLLIL